MRKHSATGHVARGSPRASAGAITLRGLDARLLRAIDRLARAAGISRSRAALRLLEEGAGLSRARPGREIGAALDRFIGTWSAAEERNLRKAVAPFGAIDEELWRTP